MYNVNCSLQFGQKPLIIPGATRFGLANVAARYVGYQTLRVEAMRCNLQSAKTKDETDRVTFLRHCEKYLKFCE